ncbi:MAG: radical SAM protein [Gammaproteobacteria bacterium]
MSVADRVSMKNGVHGVAVVSGGARASQQADQQALLAVYLSTMRQRFKDEVNRLTGGAMYAMLKAQPDAAELAFPLTYVYAFHWLQHNVHSYYREKLLQPFRGRKFGFLMDLLLADSAEDFVRGYVTHWRTNPQPGMKQAEELQHLLARRQQDPERLVGDMLSIWQSLNLFAQSYMLQFKQVGREERERYAGMLGAEDRQRLALVDALPDPGFNGTAPRFDKLGIIPAMGCPQTCRHCMFTWRPPRGKNEDPDQVYALVNQYSDSVLFTGGDLTRQLDVFYAAIAKMRKVKNFAILLNGDFAHSPEVADEVLGKMARAIKRRPGNWPEARVLLQISFDEFHQEVYVDKHGLLAERIPVARIANIVAAYPQYTKQIQLALLHKQTSLNFSHDVLQKGVFARLAQELAKRGHTIQVLHMQASPRTKRNPRAGEQAAVLKDATFILEAYPDSPILLTSSTIDGYGRAALLEEWETVKEKDLLQQVIEHGAPPGERFDIDMMLWFNGWVTLFNAVHICLGDLYDDGFDTIMARQRKDPLSRALHHFDRRLLELYAEVRDDLQEQIAVATGPHHLFHALTEDPVVRLHMTRRLLQ